ncbi:MAG: lysoplasmalogenase [Lachnospiraceae bacterium]|nr:lysoplasmalogenase [Lachnospiraceae bacterium]
MIFIIIESVIYISFIILDLWGLAPAVSDLIKYTGIILVFAHALIMFLKDRTAIDRLIVSALFFTAIADIFLLFFPDLYLPGLASFCVTQSIYTVVTTRSSDRVSRIVVPIAVLFICICVAVFSGLLNSDPSLFFLVILLPYYAVLFILNTVRSWINYRRSAVRADFIFALGLTLFVLCDINVLIRNINGFYSHIIPASISSAAVFLSWFFYLPSQVLISWRTRFSDSDFFS